MKDHHKKTSSLWIKINASVKEKQSSNKWSYLNAKVNVIKCRNLKCEKKLGISHVLEQYLERYIKENKTTTLLEIS